MFEEDNTPEEDTSGKTVMTEPKECNADALGKMVREEPKKCNALQENALGKTIREELNNLDDDHSKSDNKV